MVQLHDRLFLRYYQPAVFHSVDTCANSCVLVTLDGVSTIMANITDVALSGSVLAFWVLDFSINVCC